MNDFEKLSQCDDYVGRIVDMDYEKAIIASTDKYNNDVGGLPQRCFLLGIPEEELENTHLVLLRIENIHHLETQRILNELREDLAIRRNNKSENTQERSRGQLDVATIQKLQIIGYECKIVGEFYNDKNGNLLFGSDLERIYSYNSYKVVKPRGELLSIISSYGRPKPIENSLMKDVRNLEVGRVRYAESDINPDYDAKVSVNVEDFIGKKTAFFGQSRSGKALPEYAEIMVPVSERFPKGLARNDQLGKKDLVTNVSGNVSTIVDTTDWVELPVYEFVFKDGRRTVSAEDHVWKIHNPKAENFLKVRKTTIFSFRDNSIQSIMLNSDVTEYGSLNHLESMTQLGHEKVIEILNKTGINKCLSRSNDPREEYYDLDLEDGEPLFPVRESLKAILEWKLSDAWENGKNFEPEYKLETTLGIVEKWKRGETVEFFDLDGSLHLENVKDIGVQRVRCITVDSSDSMFMLKDGIPTHNSNSVKLITQQVFKYSKNVTDKKKRIAQIIFDPQGEYANLNSQDGGSLANMSIAEGSEIAVYNILGKSQDSSGSSLVRPLKFNFLKKDNRELCWDLMLTELRNGVSGGSNYIQPLFNLDMSEPKKNGSNDASSYQQLEIRYIRRILCMYAFMYLSKIEGLVTPFDVKFPKTMLDLSKNHSVFRLDKYDRNPIDDSTDNEKEVFEPVEDYSKHFSTIVGRNGNSDKITVKTTEGAFILFERLYTIAELYSDYLNDSWKKSFNSGELGTFRDQYDAHLSGKRGLTTSFMKIKAFHSDEASGDVRECVWKDIEAGRLIIVDLARGDMAVTRTISEMIVTYLMNKASERFIENEGNIPFQVIVEEAHNLFGRDKDDNDLIDPWVRLSKEAAKYDIGLMYSTQEISSVDPRILSNTSNWIISHLNSSNETRELSKYYGFSDWDQHLRNCESKGFIRLKTESSPFIVPVQFNKFDPNEE